MHTALKPPSPKGKTFFLTPELDYQSLAYFSQRDICKPNACAEKLPPFTVVAAIKRASPEPQVKFSGSAHKHTAKLRLKEHRLFRQ